MAADGDLVQLLTKKLVFAALVLNARRLERFSAILEQRIQFDEFLELGFAAVVLPRCNYHMQVVVCIVAYLRNLFLEGVDEVLPICLFLILLTLELALGFGHGSSKAFIGPDLVHIDRRDEGT